MYRHLVIEINQTVECPGPKVKTYTSHYYMSDSRTVRVRVTVRVSIRVRGRIRVGNPIVRRVVAQISSDGTIWPWGKTMDTI